MHIERTTPISWIVAAVAGGVLFLLGGVVTTMSSTARFVMASGAIALVALGVYTAVVARRNVSPAGMARWRPNSRRCSVTTPRCGHAWRTHSEILLQRFSGLPTTWRTRLRCHSTLGETC
ncbi:MAG: hypothetical protein QGM47_04710 [Actinomycetota bacterium]|nr:hypothetical protein [Actinomycetota bacterium]MDK1102937.1 hypothetical protein [Actinomycetota bacterium]